MTIPSSYYKTVRRDPAIVSYWRLNDIESSTRALDWANKYTLNGIYNNNHSSRSALINNDTTAGSKLFGVEHQNVEIPDAVPLRITENITIEMWVVSFSEKQTCALFNKMNTAYTFPEPYYFGLKEGKPYFSVGNGTTEKSISSEKILPLTVPVYLCAMIFRDTMTIIENTTQIATGLVGSQVVEDGEKPVYIGALGNNTKVFNGLLSEVALYSNSISSVRSLNHFNLGRQILFEPARFKTFDPPSFS